MDYFIRKILILISYSDCCLAEDDIILHYILGVDEHIKMITSKISTHRK